MVGSPDRAELTMYYYEIPPFFGLFCTFFRSQPEGLTEEDDCHFRFAFLRESPM